MIKNQINEEEILFLKLQDNNYNFANKYSCLDINLKDLIQFNYSNESTDEKIEIIIRHFSSDHDYLKINFDWSLNNFDYEIHVKNYHDKENFILLSDYFNYMKKIFLHKDEQSSLNHRKVTSINFLDADDVFDNFFNENNFLKIASEVFFVNLCSQLKKSLNYSEDEQIMIERDFAKKLLLLEQCQRTIIRQYTDRLHDQFHMSDFDMFSSHCDEIHSCSSSRAFTHFERG